MNFDSIKFIDDDLQRLDAYRNLFCEFSPSPNQIEVMIDDGYEIICYEAIEYIIDNFEKNPYKSLLDKVLNLFLNSNDPLLQKICIAALSMSSDYKEVLFSQYCDEIIIFSMSIAKSRFLNEGDIGYFNFIKSTLEIDNKTISSAACELIEELQECSKN